MNPLDAQLLDLAQREFPLCARPFARIADKLGTTEAAVLQGLARLREAGFIRRIGGVFDARALGYSSCLIAARVPEHRLEAVAATISAVPGVTHNYERAHEWNLWFTLSAETESVYRETLERIKTDTGIREMQEFPAVQSLGRPVTFQVQKRKKA